MTLDEIYTREWFEHDFAPLGPEFELVGKSIARTWPEAESAVDVGCGPGLLLRALDSAGVDCWGFDGSIHARAYSETLDEPPAIFQADLRTLWGLNPDKTSSIGRPHLVICTEVLEHIEAEHADHVVALLCRPSVPMVVTAAPPGQDGHYHVNCQPREYWLDKFAAHGAILDEDKTEELRQRWAPLQRLSHMRRNVMVIR